jgi:hypothetical protein
VRPLGSPLEPWQRAAAKLLCALRRDVDEKKPACNRRCRLQLERLPLFLILLRHTALRVLESVGERYSVTFT